jgi:hypothetical protein
MCAMTQRRRPNFGELRQREVRHSPGPRRQDFSGSWSVTSRHPLLHSGVTNATRSSRFDAEGVAPCHAGALAAELGGALATANFGELPFFSLRTTVNKGQKEGRGGGYGTPQTPTPDNKSGRSSGRLPNSRRRPVLVCLLCGCPAWCFRRVSLQALFGDAQSLLIQVGLLCHVPYLRDYHRPENQ